MYSIQFLDVETSTDLTIKQILIQLDQPSDKLLVILPGRGYTIDSPILHYLRKMGLENGYDVLNVIYSFQYAKDRVKLRDLKIDDLQNECQQAIDQALAHKPYQHLCIAGKSLGSPFASNIINTMDVPEKRLISLTPIGDAVQNAGETIPTLFVIGTADMAFIAGQAEADTRPNVTWKVYDDLNHSLEYDDSWSRSADVLQDIIRECEAFLK